MDKEILPYRPGIGAMILNEHNLVFVGQRLDNKSEAWQMPQGGVYPNETERQALMRELYEEIGTNNVKVIASSNQTYHYDLPASLIGRFWDGKYRGQKQRWFLLRFLGHDSEINIHVKNAEFKAWRWANFQELPDIVVPFKKTLYMSIIKEFEPYLADLNLPHPHEY